ncbi:MAG: type II secretion system secretin GspD [Polyangiaceae bacterium]|nr:type II secretion system secretin GspD [Polyangiaceae bacterium]
MTDWQAGSRGDPRRARLAARRRLGSKNSSFILGTSLLGALAWPSLGRSRHDRARRRPVPALLRRRDPRPGRGRRVLPGCRRGLAARRRRAAVRAGAHRRAEAEHGGPVAARGARGGARAPQRRGREVSQPVRLRRRAAQRASARAPRHGRGAGERRDRGRPARRAGVRRRERRDRHRVDGPDVVTRRVEGAGRRQASPPARGGSGRGAAGRLHRLQSDGGQPGRLARGERRAVPGAAVPDAADGPRGARGRGRAGGSGGGEEGRRARHRPARHRQADPAGERHGVQRRPRGGRSHPREPGRAHALGADRAGATERAGRRHPALRHPARHAPRNARPAERRSLGDDQRVQHGQPREGPRGVRAAPHRDEPEDPGEPPRPARDHRVQDQVNLRTPIRVWTRRARFAPLAVALVLASVSDVAAQAPPIRAPARPPTVGTPRAAGAPARPAPAPPAATPPAAPAAKPAATPDPPGASGPLPTSMDTIAKATDTPYRPKPGGAMVKFNLQDADLAELVNHISGMTGKRFIYGPKVRTIKATVVSPSPITLAEAYQAFLAILEANGMTVVPHGRFLEIVDTAGVATQPTPIYARGAPVPDEERYVTRLYRLQHVTAEEVAAVLAKFKSKDGDITVYAPGQLLILTDTGTNLQRMIRLIEEVDVGSAGSQMWIEPVHYGSASDLAKRINELFDLSAKGGGATGGLVKVVSDDQTNSLIIVGSEDSYLKLVELLRRIDTKPTGEGRVRVLALQHAVAEELAQTLTQMLQGAGRPGPQAQGPMAGMFESEVRVVADKATNSLVITSTARDYAQLRLVIDRLDAPRRQVFIEAVIMDVSVNHSSQWGLGYHAGAAPDLGGGGNSLIYGGLNPLRSIGLPTDLQGLALGVRGPEIAGTSELLGTGISIPAFGVVLNALAANSDANVLSTPHIIATDNVPAEINVGENIPLQQNFGGTSNLAGLAGLAGGQAGASGLLGALGGMGFGGFSAPRQDVGTKIKVTPHVNNDDRVRLEIEEEISEQGAASGQLGVVSITKRTAATTVVVDNQQTVVIGGLMRDSVIKTRDKIPVLGDLPVLGFLFRSSSTQKRKTNLLLILTPYVIHDQNDLRKIFERKMQERQEFLDRYFVFGNNEWEPPNDYSRTRGLVEEIRQAYAAVEEQLRLERESEVEEKEHRPGEALDLPTPVRSPGAAPSPTPSRPATPGRPATPARPAPAAAPRPRTELDAPIRINPVARSVNVERVE